MINIGKLSPNGKDVVLKQMENGCIECISHCRDNCGYTRIFINNKPQRLFRYLYEQKYGKIPKGFLVRHKCDNPHCCNIEHLELGSYRDNYQDLINRQYDKYHNARINSGIKLRGTLNREHKLTENQVKEIYLSNLSNIELAKIYNISDANVSYIKHKKAWKWFTDKLDNNKM